MSVRLLESQRVPRKGLSVDDFAKERSIDDALALLAVPGHTRHEFLNSRVHTRLYLDYDEVLETPLTPEILTDRKELVVARLDALLGPLIQENTQENTQVNYSIASRHGFSPRHSKFKVSFRPFVRGLSIPYTDIPRLLRSMRQDDFWDMSVYKDGEQLLAAINGIKDRDDPRVLTKEHVDDPDAWYVAQILDDNAVPFDIAASDSTSMTLEESSSTSMSSVNRGHSMSRNVDIALVRDVLTCLSSDRFRDYESWSRIGFALKSLGDDDIYAGIFQEPITLEDRVSVVAPWAYCPELAREKRAEVDTFLAQVLPVAEERSVVLNYFANLLCGKRCAKKFLVLTDKSGGDNGKSTLLSLFSLFFASFAETNTKFVCKGSFDRDRDSHDAGMEPMKSKRLIVAEELKHDMTLDDALLKRLSGGDGVTISGRQCGSGSRFQFTWQAGIVLLFNEGDCPKFDAGDTAFLARMLVAPMRAKFIDSLLKDQPVNPYQFPMVANIQEKFPSWLPALADVFTDHFAPLELFNSVPPSMKEWRQEITQDANPLKEWLEREIVMTGRREDILLVADLKRMYGVPERRFVEYVKAFFKGSDGGMEFVDKCQIKSAGGIWESKRGVIRGVAYQSV